MAYSTSNPPALVAQGMMGAPSLWGYSSTDIHTDVDATDYFSNGADLGMSVNDFVMVGQTTGGATLHRVSAISAAGAVTISQAILA